ncbi:PH-like domain-containing protein [Gryllotalpicola ginsengisoli]|uniref:PH-like domain-containing protein n=1 Tax=Gryllotalpicola ginsengisoli TaxID=444608 RepID=UPI0003B71A96|nr:hypothetical protein [Gryllotalpicola ginsengisoli]
MPEWASTLIVLAVLLLVFLGMWAGWRRRVRRDAGLAPVHEVPAGLGEPRAEASVLYVATTAHDAPLERLAIRGLGFRAQGRIAVFGAGALIELDGSEPVWVGAAEVVGARPAQLAIDKAVEKDGLLCLAWRLSGRVVDSYFRVREPESSGALYDAIASISTPAGFEGQASPAPQPTDHHESEV